MKRSGFIALLLSLTVGFAAAQEPGRTPAEDPTAAAPQELTQPQREALEAQRRLRMRMEIRRDLKRWQEQTGQSSETTAAANDPHSGERRQRKESDDYWRITVGNTAAENWSPHPDRELDARRLTFPMRRNEGKWEERQMKTQQNNDLKIWQKKYR